MSYNKIQFVWPITLMLGGYDELRKVYGRSELFSGNAGADKQEPRRLHIGIDIWGVEGTEIFAPLDGIVHSFANNDQFGDYGPTIILLHTTDQLKFHTLYGHLSKSDLDGLQIGKEIRKGEVFAHFGDQDENGYWPPHLHLQLVIDMEGKTGDYPGVCKYSERTYYLQNCPDPELLVQFQ